MEFRVNHPVLFLIAGLVILLVLIQSVFFLVRALRRARELGMDKQKLRKIIISVSIFTVAPAISILVGVLALAKNFGVALPWLRLSIIGSLSYETIAAETTLKQLGGVLDASGFVTVLFVMTFGIAMGLVLAPVLTRRIQKGLKGLEKRDKKWSEIFNNAMFLGMISAPAHDGFLGIIGWIVAIINASAALFCALGLGFSVAWRKKGYSKLSFAVQFAGVIGIAWTVISYAVFEGNLLETLN